MSELILYTAEDELSPKATAKESLTVQTEGQREVRRPIQHYNLDTILAVGCVRSPRGGATGGECGRFAGN